jgi:hypothetical protein
VKMAPTKIKIKQKSDCDGRLVDVILNLEMTILEMKEKLDKTYDIMQQQQQVLIMQKELNIEIMKTLNNTSPDLHSRQSNVPNKTPQYTVTLNNVSHNNSGPEGIIFFDNTSPCDTQAQEEEFQCAAPQEISTPTRSSVALPLQRKQLRSRPGRMLQSKAAAAKPSESPDTGSKAPAVQAAAPKLPGSSVPSASANRTAAPSALETTMPPVVKLPAVPTARTPPPAPMLRAAPKHQEGLQAAAPRPISLHVFNLTVETTTDDVVHHIKSKFGIQVEKCEQLKVTRGNYSSFKVDVPAHKVGIVRSHKHWPEGVSIRNFNVVEPKNYQANSGDRPPR